MRWKSYMSVLAKRTGGDRGVIATAGCPKAYWAFTKRAVVSHTFVAAWSLPSIESNRAGLSYPTRYGAGDCRLGDNGGGRPE